MNTFKLCHFHTIVIVQCVRWYSKYAISYQLAQPPAIRERFPAWDLTPEGACTACGTKCAGVFEARPGTWGQRRMPVRLAGEPTLRRARV